jgi:CDP-3, 6-dideoxy-D-glycero-L-glycero-4-hexulose-4-reductase
MKILLTGGSGFIGNNLKDYLSKDYDVYEIRRKKTKNKRINKVFYYDGEIKKLLNFFKSTKPDIVVHLASLFISEHNSLNVTNLVKDNILFSTQLLEC